MESGIVDGLLKKEKERRTKRMVMRMWRILEVAALAVPQGTLSRQITEGGRNP
jgi:hypothetical protein